MTITEKAVAYILNRAPEEILAENIKSTIRMCKLKKAYDDADKENEKYREGVQKYEAVLQNNA